MKTLLLGPYFANAGHGAECGVYDALVKNGHNVIVYDPRAKKFMENGRVSDAFEPDIIFGLNLVLVLGPGLTQPMRDSFLWKEGLGDAVKVLWNSEPLRLPNYYSRMDDNKNEFDFFFTFDESDIPQYNKLGITDVAFLPQAYNPTWYKPTNDTVLGHFCFVGSVGGKWVNREHFLRRVQQYCVKNGRVLNIYSTFDAQRVNTLYNIHCAVLNLGLYHSEQGPPENLKSFGLQQRIFEGIGAGQVVITNELPGGSNELFTHGEDILFYNRNNLEEVLEQSLDMDLRKLMKDNILSIREQHTYMARISQMMSILQDNGKI